LQTSIKWTLFLCTLACCAAGGIYFHFTEDEEDKANVKREAAPPEVGSVAALPESHSQGIPAAQNQAHLQPIKNKTFAPYVQKDLYPYLMSMQSAKTAGSWGSGLQLLRSCAAASTGLAFYSEASVVNDPHFALRQEAKDKVAKRCGGIPLGQYIQQFTPLADDEYGKRYSIAKETIRNFHKSSPADIANALQELAKQGKLEEAEILIRQAKRWDGRRWSGNAEDFDTVVLAAAELASASPGQELEDIRLLTRCFRYGQCDFTYGSMPRLSSEERRGEYEAIAREMASAMRRGEINRFFIAAENQ
jgi:hypothetical protein